MPKADQKVAIRGDKIEIIRSSYKKIAFATYDKELFDKISSVTWTLTKDSGGKEYIVSKKYGSLHRLVVAHFYGEDYVTEAYKQGYVIDHMDNNGYECTYENLVTIPRKENVAKGQTYDIERKESIRKFAINITRDFNTKEFQISVIFNKHIDIVENDIVTPLSVIYFKYGTDYKTTFIDARSIINDLNSGGKLNLGHLRCDKYSYKKAEIVFASKEDIESGMYIKDGKMYIIQGSPSTIMLKTNHNKGLHEIEDI
ncbi:HNH endonuclease [Clostridium sp. FP2]|uniref:HNH endonuclease n=1 Tax=Clostridium sp. FP2 TaxID=2724481 RepID=UPI0013E92FC5|nr:HNH endonuclease [Clostridium sp. FP2]MBZ9622943.1 HNH endonuclease [Clostridium sp. FP2]